MARKKATRPPRKNFPTVPKQKIKELVELYTAAEEGYDADGITASQQLSGVRQQFLAQLTTLSGRDQVLRQNDVSVFDAALLKLNNGGHHVGALMLFLAEFQGVNQPKPGRLGEPVKGPPRVDRLFKRCGILKRSSDAAPSNGTGPSSTPQTLNNNQADLPQAFHNGSMTLGAGVNPAVSSSQNGFTAPATATAYFQSGIAAPAPVTIQSQNSIPMTQFGPAMAYHGIEGFQNSAANMGAFDNPPIDPALFSAGCASTYGARYPASEDDTYYRNPMAERFAMLDEPQNTGYEFGWEAQERR